MPFRSFHTAFAAWLLFCVAGPLQAQWRGPQLTRLGPDEGLPAYINSITQDSTGYMYFASNVGLFLYDGHSLAYFGHDPLDSTSIGSGAIYTTLAGADGTVWLTSQFGGLTRFNPGTREFKRYPFPELPFRSVPTSHGLYEDEAGVIWVGATHFRLMAFDKKTEQYTTYTPLWLDAAKDNRRLTILSIVPDIRQKDLLWLSILDYGMEHSDFNSYRLVSFNTTTKVFTDHSCMGQTRLRDADGVLWGTYWGTFISRFDPATLQCDTFQYQYSYKGERRYSVAEDLTRYRGQVVVSTSKAILDFSSDHSFEVMCQPDLPEEEYVSLFVDRDDNLWIGTNQGAYALNPDHQHIRFFSLNVFGERDRIFPGRLAYHAPQDAIYLSHTSNPDRKGFSRISLSESSNKTSRFFPTDFHIQGIACDTSHRIWVAGNGALYQVDTNSHALLRSDLIPPGDPPLAAIQNIKTSPEGWLGAISHTEFTWFHPDRRKVNRLSIHNLPGSAYAKSYDNAFEGFSFGKNNTAFLFSNEIHLLDLASGRTTALKYDPIINPATQRILYVGEDDAGRIWISTFVHIGMFRLEKDSLMLLQTYGITDGMISPTAAELHMDGHGRVWAFTGSGLNCIDPESGEIRFFGTKEGLPYPFLDPRQVLTISDDRIATVAGDGLIVFPAEALWNSAAPSGEPVVIKDIRINGKRLETEDALSREERLELHAGNVGVDIEFQALAFPTDYRMEYSYRIVGLQNDWISLGRNKLVTLPTLSPGEYTFQVKAGRPHSQSPVTALHIFVPTPLYRKGWFILLVFGGIMSAVYLAVRYRIRTIRMQEAERMAINKQMAELELKALRSQMNPHFMFNSLNSIKNYILQAQPKLAAEYLSNFAHLIRMILQHSREKSITLEDELETLLLYIELEKIRFEDKFEFSCMVEDGLQLGQITIPPMLLQPFVENAIWHGLMHKKGKGRLMLSFSKQKDMIACIIEDDGVGRDKAAEMKSLTATKYKSMGMGITRDRIEIMNKMDALGITVEVVDKTDADGRPAGTKVIVTIPGTADA